MLKTFENKALSGRGLSSEEALSLTRIPDTSLFDILASTEKIRFNFKGNEVNLCSIVSAKSGLCAEDCNFCSQSSKYNTDIDSFPIMDSESIIDSAMHASDNNAREFSIVTSGTGINKESDIGVLTSAIKGINAKSDMEICASLGITKRETLLRLKEAGLHSYHHNLETARSFFPNICTTHEYDDDLNSIKTAKELGFHVCSGGIFGVGESWEQRVELGMTLRELDVDSIPINFLNPRPGTPFEKLNLLSPMECLKIIALYRFMLPTKNIIICGGREINLRDLQCLIFAAGANGMMVGNYLTTQGRAVDNDLKMLSDLGFKPRK
jgi:biotin synthase